MNAEKGPRKPWNKKREYFIELIVQGQPVRIAKDDSECGGEYFWMRQKPSGEWITVGCICHNPALGI